MTEENKPSRREFMGRVGWWAALGAIGAGAGYGTYRLGKLGAAGDKLAAKGAEFDDAAMRKVDEGLLTWKLVNVVPTNLKSVRAMAVLKDGGIAVIGEKVVRIIEGNQQEVEEGKPKPISARVLRDIQLESVPTAIESYWDQEGERLYVGLRDHVEVYSLEGKRLAVWPKLGDAASKDNAQRKAWISSVRVYDEGAFLGDAGRRVVVRCNAKGEVAGEIGQADESKHAPGLVLPSPHLDVAPCGEFDGIDSVWVNNPGRHEMELYNLAGELKMTWGKAGTRIQDFVGCCNPTNFTSISQGLVTTEKGIARVKVYDREGNLLSVIAGPEDFPGSTGGAMEAMDVARLGNMVAVLEPWNKTIRFYVEKNGRGVSVGGL